MIALKRMTVMLLVVLLLFESVHFRADALSAHAAVCINGDTGEVIFSRNADGEHYKDNDGSFAL